MTEQHYAIFAIGPVQSFIAASRKLEDLWGGSYLLSFLIKQAIASLREICKEHGGKHNMIYPYDDLNDNSNNNPNDQKAPNSKYLAVANYPNRITFTLEADSPTASKVMSELESEVREELQRIARWAVNRVFASKSESSQMRVKKLQDQACEQVNMFLEVNWLAYPIEVGPLANSDYRRQAEQHFHALKSQRPLRSMPETGLACTLYQRMDALCYEPPLPTDRYADLKRKLRDTWSQRHADFRPRIEDEDNARIRDNEYLCGISLVRRVARDFFAAEYPDQADAFRKYESVNDLGAEADRYFAVLSMDGDEMGQFFNRGEVRETSKQLSHFASQVVPVIVEEYGGKLLYAGGDDVLAVFPVQHMTRSKCHAESDPAQPAGTGNTLPLTKPEPNSPSDSNELCIKNVLQAAYQLRLAFGDKVNGLEGATASTGIVIGHQTTPLQQLLDQVRLLEKKAKSFKVQAKNAFALSVKPRSGEFLGPLVLPWVHKEMHEERVLTQELSAFVKLLNEMISTTFIYEFASTFQSCVSIRDKERSKPKYIEPDYMKEIVSLECLRLIKRSLRDEHKQNWDGIRSGIPDIDLYWKLLKTGGLIDMFKMLAFFNRREKVYAGAHAHSR